MMVKAEVFRKIKMPWFDFMGKDEPRLYDPEKSKDVTKLVVFDFPDADEKWSVHVRKGIAEVQPFIFAKPD